MSSILRTMIYAGIFVGLVFVIAPARLLAMSGLVPPQAIGPGQILGLLLGVPSGLLALWCVATFATLGRGTPAPFDPPRKLVVRGPYAYVRNPMYLGAGGVLVGAALFYGSPLLLAYASLLMLTVALFVVYYEEPTLSHTFGDAYEDYKTRVRRWLPRWPAQSKS